MFFDGLVRNVDQVSRWAKGAACCFVGGGAVWRCYDQLNEMSEMYAMVLCVFFAFSMIGVGVSIINEEEQRKEQ